MDVFTLAQVGYCIAALAVIWYAISLDPVFHDTLKRWLTGDQRKVYIATLWKRNGERIELDYRFRYQCLRFANSQYAITGNSAGWLTIRDKRLIRYTERDEDGIAYGNPGIVAEYKYYPATLTRVAAWLPVYYRTVAFDGYMERVIRPDEQNEWDKTIAESLFRDDFRRGTTV